LDFDFERTQQHHLQTLLSRLQRLWRSELMVVIQVITHLSPV